MVPRLGAADTRRFFSKIEKQLGDGCWEWKAGTTLDRYGVFKYFGKNRRAHRIAWLIRYGYWPDLLVCHTCDNPACVRWSHLFVGSDQDNKNDAVQKSRHARGNKIGCSRLAPQQVLIARQQFDRGIATISELARACSVTYKAMELVVKREVWRHV